jgi:MscS family membrane protein
MLLKKPVAHLIVRVTGAFVNRFTDSEDSKLFRTLTQRPLELLLQTIFFYVAVNQLNILLNKFVIHRYKERIDKLTKIRQETMAVSFGDIADHLFLFFVILFTVWFLSRIVDFIYRLAAQKARAEDNKERQQLLPLLKEVGKLIVWSIGLFWVLGSVFHVNIPALITGLGIGGVAIALAAKTSVENLFAAFTILTDKPFQTGDVIKIGGQEGTVERIGFRSIRLRNGDGSLYIIPNQKMVTESLENLTKRDVRRVKIVINIKYGLEYEELQKLGSELKAMVKQVAHVKDPIDISLEGFEENVFQLVLSYHLPSPLEAGASLSAIKNEVSMRTYEIVNKYTQIKTDSK